MKQAAPNINIFLFRPTMVTPPIYTMKDLNEWVTLKDVYDAHELLNLREAEREAIAASR